VAPTAADLDDPLGFVERVGSAGGSDMDAALDEILRGGERGQRGGEHSGEGGTGETGGGETGGGETGGDGR
jgi:hypothetical protein